MSKIPPADGGPSCPGCGRTYKATPLIDAAWFIPVGEKEG